MLVPALRRLALRRSNASQQQERDTYEHGQAQEPWGLVRRKTTLGNTDKVIRHLPDILGRALARSWIDPRFSDSLMSDPLGLLASHNVFLPDNIRIEIETTASERQRVVVYERGLDGRDKRLLYLQLVMMAGK